ncbi:MAG TPA: hypothetical protein VKS60_09835 [Stellaceae bacterium]|nr:hypothetical protein [Stellaceae bacterium]
MTTTWEDELPVPELPPDPTWRENFCFDGYDRQRDVGFWIHCGRWSLDPRIWREQVLLYMPDGTYLVHRAWGRRDSVRGPSAALLDLICEAPGEAWRLRYRGPARRTEAKELLGGPLPEAPQLLLDLDVRFTSRVPMWDMTAGIKSQAWGKFHIEQTGRLHGSIRWGEESVDMDGLGWHDHSRGPRDMKDMGRHCWIHGNLSRGRSFALTCIDNFVDGRFVRALDKAVIWDEGVLHEARCPAPPFLESNATPPQHYEMALDYAGGRIEIAAEPRRCLPHSTSRYMECFDGVTPGIAHVVTYEQGTVLTVDGEQFDGHTERSFRL